MSSPKPGSLDATSLMTTASDSIITTKSTPLKICEDYDSDDADVVLISSDNYRFRVHSYRLQCFSPVFRSMIAMAQSSSQRDPIVFTDKWVECSRVVKSALDIIYSSVVGEITEDNINSHLYVLDFARKWDITIIPILMGNYVRLAVTKNGCLAFELLIVSLKMKDNDLATIAFGATDREEWNQEQDFYPAPTESTELDDDSMTVLPPNYESAPYPEYDCLEDSHGGDIFDLGASSLQWFLRLPPTVVWIILRSQHLVSKDHKDLRPQKVAKYFGDLMNTIYPPAPSANMIKKRKMED